MGVVYRAIDRKLGRPVALKFLPQQWSHDEGAKQRFLREAQAASATDHPNICTIHDIATADDGQLFIVMAHYAGETLKRRLEAGPLPIDQALDIATQVADGLARAHAQGIVHRDIKPGNLILTEDGVRIVDFGLATFMDALQLTAEGSTLGTAAYMSPEQVRGEEVDARTDVWAVGVVLYQMLVGHTPFRGAYAEAIGYAIRNDPPPPLRGERPEIPEDIEQLVFRALHKDPAVRFASGRELARALRQVRGLTLPQDLRTQAIAYEAAPPAVPDRRRLRRQMLAAGLLVAVAAAALAALLFPVTRVPIVIAPVVNLTGEGPLDQARMALAHLITGQLAESRHVRVLPYERSLSILRVYRDGGKGVIGPAALQALETHSGARVIVIPTLMYEDGAYSAQIRFRTAGAATDAVAPVETAPILSSLPADAAYRLTRDVATVVDRHFAAIGPTRGSVLAWLREVTGRTAPMRPHARTLEAAIAFERGVDAYDQQEYHAALQSFTAATDLDSGNALAHAWVGRTAHVMRRPNDAAKAALQALALKTDDTPVIAGLLVDATAAEIRREFDAAEEYYAALVRRFPDEPAWVAERAALLDRQGRIDDAINAHVRALALDPGRARSELDLCRLYNGKRDTTKAKDRGRRAFERFSTLGDAGGAAQAHLCLTDAMRQGNAEELAEARRHASTALSTFTAAGAAYNVARALHYVALVANAQSELKVAADSWDQALPRARAVGNANLEAAILNNIGVAFERLGNPIRALQMYSEGYAFHANQGNESGATASLANVGAIRIQYGAAADRERGLREVDNALKNAAKAGDKSFEVFCLQARANYHRAAAEYRDAERLLLQADAIAEVNGLQDKLESIAIDLARVALDRGDYAGARDRLATALKQATGPAAAEISILLAQAQVRLGDLTSPAAHLTAAEETIRRVGEGRLSPLLELAAGELAIVKGNRTDARRHFANSAGRPDQALRDPASVKASGYLQAMANGTIRIR
jgi:tetratricopeptide (TPR) repeat protein